MTSAQPIAKDRNAPALVLYGTDETKKPRAAYFKAAQATLAAKAAGLMDLKVLKVETVEQSALAARLPSGRLYANGRGLVPFVRHDLYAKVVEAAGGAADTPQPRPQHDRRTARAVAANAKTQVKAAASKGDQSVAGPTVTGPARNWSTIEVGHLVIAQELPEDGWYEAIVVAKDGDALTLRWRDYPKYKPFIRHRSTVALVDPDVTA